MREKIFIKKHFLILKLLAITVLVSGKHLQLSLCELSEAQDNIFK